MKERQEKLKVLKEKQEKIKLKNDLIKEKKKKLKQKKASKRRRKTYETSESDSDCSYKSNNSSDCEDLETYRKNILNEESLEEDMFELAPPKFKKEKYKTPKPQKTIQKSVQGIQIGNKINDEEPSSSSKEYLAPQHKLQVGDFILAKFSSPKGKRTYRYVCVIQDIIEKKLVVKGLKCKKGKKVFKMIADDISIIHMTDVILCLPLPVFENENDIVTFPCEVDILECK